MKYLFTKKKKKKNNFTVKKPGRHHLNLVIKANMDQQLDKTKLCTTDRTQVKKAI